jgi:CheY-like chemotaxis protein
MPQATFLQQFMHGRLLGVPARVLPKGERSHDLCAMWLANFHSDRSDCHEGHASDGGDRAPEDRPRLNLLLTYGGWREGTVVDQLPRLLSPMGIYSIRAESCEEAADVIRSLPVHIAVVDLSIPLQRGQQAADSGGARTLQLLKRLEPAPPTVVVRPPQPASRESVRGLLEALRTGAFAVLDRPLELETLLEVMRRILRRYYADAWPG